MCPLVNVSPSKLVEWLSHEMVERVNCIVSQCSVVLMFGVSPKGLGTRYSTTNCFKYFAIFALFPNCGYYIQRVSMITLNYLPTRARIRLYHEYLECINLLDKIACDEDASLPPPSFRKSMLKSLFYKVSANAERIMYSANCVTLHLLCVYPTY